MATIFLSWRLKQRVQEEEGSVAVQILKVIRCRTEAESEKHTILHK